MEIIVHPKVDDDLVGHIEYYSHHAGSEIAIDFFAELLRCFDSMVNRAGSFPLYTPRFRRVNFA